MSKINNFLVEDSLCPQIRQRLVELEKIVSFLKARLSKAPSGSIRTALNPGRKPQFYLISKTGDTNGKYIRHKEISKAAAIMQRDYDKQALALIQEQISALKKALKIYSPDSLKALYDSLRLPRKNLTASVALSQSSFSRQWQDIPYEHKSFSADTPELYTSGGLRVRSKSELLIAEALDKFNVPYRYEFPLELNSSDGSSFTVHPDFFCLNVRTGQEIIWEHLGLLEDESYARSAVRKLNSYQRSGFFPGESLIVTTESSELPANSRTFVEVIKKYLI